MTGRITMASAILLAVFVSQAPLKTSADELDAKICPAGDALFDRLSATLNQGLTGSTIAERQNEMLDVVGISQSEQQAWVKCADAWAGKNTARQGYSLFRAAQTAYDMTDMTRAVGLDSRSKLEMAFDLATTALEIWSDPSLSGNPWVASLQRSAHTLIEQIRNAESNAP